MKRIVLFIVLFPFATGLLAKEGMWIPSLLEKLNMNEMSNLGMKLTAEQIYSINKSSLKDAVVHFNGGCTSEIISSQGLLLTNHHCGYSSIQSHSSVEHDYLTDGFWAMSKQEELKTNLTATIIVRIEDVTKKVLEGIIEEMSSLERDKAIAENIKKVGEAAIEGTHYEAQIRPFYYGNEYYMFIRETFKDIRLVGAPPSSIGKFGGDTDNWMWPRHTGDFSIFRIYADSVNQPAVYSENNVPYTPKHYFPISLKGVKKDDFTMVYGFPGRTSEYLTSYAVDYIMNKSNPARIKMRERSLGIMGADMKTSDAIRIKYAAKYARISNYHKKWIGENRGLNRLHAIDKKRELEANFTKLVEDNPPYRKKYGNLLTQFEELYKKREKYAFARDYWIELVYYGPEIIRYANSFRSLVQGMLDKTMSDETIAKTVDRLKKGAKGRFKNYNAPTDQKLLAGLVPIYYQSLDETMRPAYMQEMHEKYKGNEEAYAKDVFDNSMLTSEEKVVEMLTGFNAGSAKKLKKDPAFRLMEAVYDKYNNDVRLEYTALEAKIEDLNRLYIQALMKLLPDRRYYPDANSTLRIAYGKVEGYEPADAVVYNHYTTLAGVVQKADPNSDEFNVPQKLLDLYEKKDYGPYGQDGELWVCFTASNHTTGGNSGSPVLDARGNLIGLNFDRGWEGTMSDIMFDPERCRNISVDVRYVLFIIDKFAGAGYLVDEMQLVAERKSAPIMPEKLEH